MIYKKHIFELDSIRAIAALSVMFLHFIPSIYGSNNFIEFLKKYHSVFQFGVPIFFVLSGFLISRILFEKKSEERYFVNFYTKRALRIFPLYYVVCLLIFFVFPNLLSGLPTANLNEIWPNLFYLQNFFISFNLPYVGPNHFWSLAVEEHFYLIWPLIIYYFDKINIKIIIITVIVIQPILRILLIQKQIDIYYFTFTRLDEILYGSLLAIYEKEGRKISKKDLGIAIALVIIFAGLFVIFSGTGSLLIQGFKYSFFGYLFFCLVGLLALNNFKNVKILRSKFLVYTGKISYGLYIYHPFVFTIYCNYFPLSNPILFFVASFGITYLIASASFFYFEKPILNLKYFFLKDLREN